MGVAPGNSGITLHESGYLLHNENWVFPNVFSPFWRLQYNENRGHSMLFGDRMIELTPDHLVLIPDHHLFHCLGQKPVSSCWQLFSFTQKLHKSVAVPLVLPIRDTEVCLIRDLKTLITDNPSLKPSDAILSNSLALLEVVLTRPEVRRQAPMPAALEHIKPYIELHIGQKLSNSHLAQQAGMSVAGFEGAFKRHFGTTAAQFVTELRVREASRLLLQTTKSLDDIAAITGFPNRAYFTRVFTRVTGGPPGRFRRTHRAQASITP
jgi:AraC family transcriptional regulator of arabinose operon